MLAKNEACRKCNKKGHFASVCKQGVSQAKSHVRRVEQAHDQVQVLTTSFTKQSVTCEIHLAHVPTKRLVDTGSSVSILSKDVYRRHFLYYKLVCSSTTLLDYSGKDIPLSGEIRQTGAVRSDTAPAHFPSYEQARLSWA